jgi:hypothetical protein
MAQLTSASINDLPDDAFAYIEPGGKKDSGGKTIPRSLRHFPVHDAAHARNALARMSQSPFGAKAKGKIMAAARKFGVTVGSDGRALEDGANAPEVERRFLGEHTRAAYDMRAGLELREEANGKHIVGYATVFNRRSRNLGGFVEEVDPQGPRRNQMEGFPGTVCRWNHDPNWLLGTISGRTLNMTVDRLGVFYDVLPPQSRGDILELVQRGDVRHSSFAFRVPAGGDEWGVTDDTNYPLRRIMDYDSVDVAPVVSPAYEDATAGLRSLAEFKEIEFDEVRAMAEGDDLKRLFVRTDNRGLPVRKPEPAKPGMFGPAAAAALLSRKADPWGELG